MRFPLFNRDDFNTHHQFYTLSPEAWDLLNQANLEYEKLPQSYLGLSGKDFKQYKSSLISNIYASDRHKFHQESENYRRDCHRIRMHRWYLQQVDYLNKMENWKCFFQITTNRNQLLELHKEWEKHKTFAHFSSLAIYATANAILPVFTQYFRHAQLELKSKKLSYREEKLFTNYLKKLQQNINSEKAQLCEAMLVRLAVASQEKNLAYDDVILTLLRKLQYLNIIKPFSNIQPRQDLTSDLYCFFHKFIQKNGDGNQRRRLLQFAWFTDAHLCTPYLHKNEYLIAPKIFIEKGLIPSKLRRPLILFQGHNFRHDFFANHFHLMSQLNLLPQLRCQSMNLPEATDHYVWKVLLTMTENLNNELNSLDKIKSSWWDNLIHKKTLLFKLEWRTFLISNIAILIDKKLLYLYEISQQLRTRLDFELDLEMIHSEEFRKILQNLISNIETDFNKFEITSQNKKVWQEIKIIFERVIRHSEEKSNAKLNQENKENPSAQIEHLFSVLLDGRCFNLKLLDFEEQFKKLEIKLNEIKNSTTESDCEPYFKRIFKAYLHSLLNTNLSTQHHLLQAIEKLILERGPEYISERCKLLSELKITGQSDVVKIKCQALLFSLEENEFFNLKPSELPSWNKRNLAFL